MTTPDVTASALAEKAAGQWRAVVHEQLRRHPDHGEFYALAGELVDTLRSLESLMSSLDRQVGSYGHGRALRDDEGHDPASRLAEACGHLGTARELLAGAERAVNEFWSAIGHIATEEDRS